MSIAEITLPVLQPFTWDKMLNYLQSRLIAGEESIENGYYHRKHQGDTIRITYDVQQEVLVIHHDKALNDAQDLIERCQQLFAPQESTEKIYQHLSQSLPIDSGFIGFRPLGCWDRFELCIRTIIGQQVSVKAAQTLMQRLLQRCGSISAAAVANTTLDNIGMPGRRVQTMQNFAQAVDQQQLDLDQDWPSLRADLLALPGIGPWTCDYLAIRLGRDNDAFPASDLGLIRAAGADSAKALLQLAEQWRPYRAYAACFLWAGPN